MVFLWASWSPDISPAVWVKTGVVVNFALN
jgi:hypothetical protein